jgi:DNA-binding response OmpR family regulator
MPATNIATTQAQIAGLLREDQLAFDRSIDVQILRLRRKIESNPSEPQLIRTERGAGYYLDCEVEVS